MRRARHTCSFIDRNVRHGVATRMNNAIAANAIASSNGGGTLDFDDLGYSERVHPPPPAYATVSKHRCANGADIDTNDKTAARQAARFTLMKAMYDAHPRAVELLSAWDEDGSGNVTRTEFRKAMKATGFLSVSKEELDDVFDVLDEPCIGLLEYNELQQLLRRAMGGQTQTAAVATPSAPKSPSNASRLEELGSAATAETVIAAESATKYTERGCRAHDGQTAGGVSASSAACATESEQPSLAACALPIPGAGPGTHTATNSQAAPNAHISDPVASDTRRNVSEEARPAWRPQPHSGDAQSEWHDDQLQATIESTIARLRQAEIAEQVAAAEQAANLLELARQEAEQANEQAAIEAATHRDEVLWAAKELLRQEEEELEAEREASEEEHRWLLAEDLRWRQQQQQLLWYEQAALNDTWAAPWPHFGAALPSLSPLHPLAPHTTPGLAGTWPQRGPTGPAQHATAQLRQRHRLRQQRWRRQQDQQDRQDQNQHHPQQQAPWVQEHAWRAGRQDDWHSSWPSAPLAAAAKPSPSHGSGLPSAPPQLASRPSAHRAAHQGVPPSSAHRTPARTGYGSPAWTPRATVHDQHHLADHLATTPGPEVGGNAEERLQQLINVAEAAASRYAAVRASVRQTLANPCHPIVSPLPPDQHTRSSHTSGDASAQAMPAPMHNIPSSTYARHRAEASGQVPQPPLVHSKALREAAAAATDASAYCALAHELAAVRSQMQQGRQQAHQQEPVTELGDGDDSARWACGATPRRLDLWAGDSEHGAPMTNAHQREGVRGLGAYLGACRPLRGSAWYG